MNKILNFKGEYKGLDSQTAQDNLLFYGYNSAIKHSPEHHHEQQKQAKIRFYSVFKSLRVYLMLAASLLYFFAGQSEAGYELKGTWLLLLTLGVCAFEIFMENNCAKKLNAITATSGVIVRAVRDGKIVLVKRENIVQDDLIILQGGENVPADAHILEASNVTVDESVFSDSSKPVKKHPGSDGRNDLKQSCVYKGTKIISGILIARVFATGQDVKLRPQVQSAKEVYQTRFEAFVNRQSVKLTYASAILLIAVSAIRIIAMGNTPSSEVESDTLLAHFAITLLPAFSFALCAIPVSLSLIVRIYYINGAQRLSEKYGEIKSLRAVETLNSVTAVCLDKDSIIVSDSTPITEESSPNKDMLSRIAALSCRVTDTAASNSYEKAIFVGAAFKHIKMKELHGDNTLLRSYAPERDDDYNKMNGNLWEINSSRLLCVKGAPEVVLSYCNLTPEKLYPIQKQQLEYTKQGHHVLAVAFAKLDGVDEEGEYNNHESTEEFIPDTLFEAEYTFLGLIAFSTEIRNNIPIAVKNYYKAGIKVFMMTSDTERSGGKETALSIARKVGIKEEGVISGNKADIIEKLKMLGEVTAVFGTDSSDTKALELADVGIALSKFTTRREWDSGMDTLSQATTGSACEACDFIMEETGVEEDGLVKAAGAFRAARQMHRNIKRCISIAISTFIAVFLFGLINMLFWSNFLLEAVFVSTLSVLIIPLITIFFLKNEADLKTVQRASSFIAEGRVNRNFIISATIQGASLFTAVLVMFLISNVEIDAMRSVFLTVFTSGAIAMAWVGMSYEKPFYKSFKEAFVSKDCKTNPAIIFTGLLLLLPLLIYLPYINSTFGLDAVSPLIFLLSMAVGALSQLWFEFIKKRYKD